MAITHDFIYEDKDGNKKTQELVSSEFRTWMEALPEERKNAALGIYNENSNNLDRLISEGKLERTIDNKLIWYVPEIAPSEQFQNLYDEYLTATGLIFTIDKT